MPSLLITVPLALTLTTAQTAKPAQQPRASVESRWEHAYCDLTELTRTSETELTVRYRYRNTGKQNVEFPHQANLVGYTQALDPVNGVLYGILKDSAGKYLGSSTVGDLSAKPLPPGGSQVHWARLEPPPATVTAVTIHVAGCMPFEGVSIGGDSRVPPLTAPRPPVASQDGEEEGLVVELVEARRVAGGAALVQVRYRNAGTKEFQFPHQGSALRLAYITDPKARQKFTVLTDKRGYQIASSTLQLDSASGAILTPGRALNIWARFAAPAETAKEVSLTVFGAPPFDKIPLTGEGTASTAGGSSIGGDTIGLDAALKALGAKVTEAEIRIDLAADVLFDFDKATLKKDAESSLQKVATILKAHPSAKTTIEGHTDGKGNDAYNQTLSEQRAESVKGWLVSAGANNASIATRGLGKTKPIAHNTKPDGADDPDGRAKNRRVEIVVRKGA